MPYDPVYRYPRSRFLGDEADFPGDLKHKEVEPGNRAV